MAFIICFEFANIVAVVPQLAIVSLLAMPTEIRKQFFYNALLNNLQLFEIKIFKWEFELQYWTPHPHGLRLKAFWIFQILNLYAEEF
jgi:hypothetical protein